MTAEPRSLRQFPERKLSLMDALVLVSYENGCRTPDEGLRWALLRGYVRHNGDDNYTITDAGRERVGF